MASDSTVVSHVVVPVFIIVTVTIAVPLFPIFDGTSAYETNAASSPALAATGAKAKARESPTTEPKRSEALLALLHTFVLTS